MRLRSTVLALVLAVALLTACTPVTGTGGSGTTGTATAPPSAQTTGATTGPLVEGAEPTTSPFIAPAMAVRRVVVNVGITGRVPGLSGSQTLGNGSGIIIRSNGYILTNQHVVSAGSGITATIGSSTVPAKIVGQDASTDLAVIKVDMTGLPAANIGNPSALTVGQYVIAVGYPFGVGSTVTHGIVSALGRSTLAPQGNSNPHGGTTASSTVAAYTDLIQTDAAINPGNSGGALATLDGSIVGVNTLIESGTGSSSGIGFAIPIDFAMNIADQLIKTGKAVHPFLGVLISSASGQRGVTATQGVLIQQVQPGGAAAKAGIKAGDVIVAINGIPVTDVEDLYAALRQQKIGQTVPFTIIRGGKQQTVQVTIGSDKSR